jgi:hypothetical protein
VLAVIAISEKLRRRKIKIIGRDADATVIAFSIFPRNAPGASTDRKDDSDSAGFRRYIFAHDQSASRRFNTSPPSLSI